MKFNSLWIIMVIALLSALGWGIYLIVKRFSLGLPVGSPACHDFAESAPILRKMRVAGVSEWNWEQDFTTDHPYQHKIQISRPDPHAWRLRMGTVDISYTDPQRLIESITHMVPRGGKTTSAVVRLEDSTNTCVAIHHE